MAINKNIICPPCRPCDVVCGWGGAGAFSDGKLTISTEVGGRLREYVGDTMCWELIREVDSTYRKFGASGEMYGISDEVSRLENKASLVGLRLIPAKLRHIGTDSCRNEVLKGLYDSITGKVDIQTGITAQSITVEDGILTGIETDSGQGISCDYLIVAPGREGADWFAKEALKMGLKLAANPVDLGVRVEVPYVVLEELTDVLYEAKLVYYSETFDDRI
ncbi:MAG: FAD-dependent oxidoreductase, partial [Chloroflexi bacterium]|nr:FAD-dependent oxidoreductase [Chloroflexota bacterium]